MRKLPSKRSFDRIFCESNVKCDTGPSQLIVIHKIFIFKHLLLSINCFVWSYVFLSWSKRFSNLLALRCLDQFCVAIIARIFVVHKTYCTGVHGVSVQVFLILHHLIYAINMPRLSRPRLWYFFDRIRIVNENLLVFWSEYASKEERY